MPRTKLPKGSVPVTFRLPREVQQRLMDKARREEMSFSKLIRRALFREIGTAWAPRSPQRNAAADRRNKKGQFKDVVDVGRSLAANRKRTAKTTVKKGQGDRGIVKD